MRQKTTSSFIAWQNQPNHEAWYVSDLPGHNGTSRIKKGSGRNSDWGFTTKASQAIALSPYWLRRFVAYCKRDRNRTYGSSVVLTN